MVAGFTARPGGLSAGGHASLNWSYMVGDDPSVVAENRRRALAAFGLTPEQAVVAGLVHGSAVAVVDGPPAGWPYVESGPVPPATPVRRREGSGFIGGVDALATALPGIALVITAADCVPLYIVDPQRRAIGAGHAGWRGTVGNVAGALVQAMARGLGCRPVEMWAVVGPSIGACCYEVDAPVIEPLRQALPADWEALATPTGPGKWHLDLWGANRRQLLAAGLPASHILAEGPCTSCHSDRLFSHRAQLGPAGRGAAVLALQAGAS